MDHMGRLRNVLISRNLAAKRKGKKRYMARVRMFLCRASKNMG
jgi:hypothetical protein